MSNKEDLKKLLFKTIAPIVGNSAEILVELLTSKKHVNEFVIAKRLDITINQARNLLYRLSNDNLVSSIREKDQKKGWYTYFWKLEVLKVLLLAKENTSKRISILGQQLEKRRLKKHYSCKRCKLEYDEENAMLIDFTCPECGDIFTVKNDAKLIKGLERNIKKYEFQLELILNEIELEKERIEKEKEKEKEKQKKKKIKKKITKKKTTKKTKPKKTQNKTKSKRKKPSKKKESKTIKSKKTKKSTKPKSTKTFKKTTKKASAKSTRKSGNSRAKKSKAKKLKN
jgi:transcription factor E